jgi:hypothetical protein
MKTAKHSHQGPHLHDDAMVPAAGAASPAKDPGSVPAVIASVFGKLNLERRARLLGRLLGSVGPLALVVVAGGAFAKYLRHAGWREVPISFEDAARATSSQVYDVVHYVEQSNPHLIQGLLGAMSQDGMAMTALGASAAAITFKRLAGARGWKPQSSSKQCLGAA